MYGENPTCVREKLIKFLVASAIPLESEMNTRIEEFGKCLDAHKISRIKVNKQVFFLQKPCFNVRRKNVVETFNVCAYLLVLKCVSARLREKVCYSRKKTIARKKLTDLLARYENVFQL